MEAYVKSHTDHLGITSIEFYHPQSNSLPANLLSALSQEIHHASLNNETRLIILRSAGEKAFCAGASFDELSAISNEKEGLQFFSGFANVINSIRKCPKFIIGRIHGRAVGGGVGLAAAVDYAIATEASDIKLSELAMGIGPFVVGPAVERKIGTAAFSQLSIDAAMWRNADWAKRKGLYAEMHPDIPSMDESMLRLSNALAHSNPEAMAAMKAILWKGTENWDQLLAERAAISGHLVISDYSKKAIAAFKAKR